MKRRGWVAGVSAPVVAGGVLVAAHGATVASNSGVLFWQNIFAVQTTGNNVNPPPGVTPSVPGNPGGGAPTVGTASQEIQSLGQPQGKTGAEISAKLTTEGYTPVTGNNGGTIWTKAGSDGNTAVVRVDPAMVRTNPRGFADEVPHVHKEIVPSNRVTNGNYSPADVTSRLNDQGLPSTDPRQTHIPGGQ